MFSVLLALFLTAPIQGKVLDPMGAPVAAARVTVVADGGAPTTVSAVTDNRGTFTLSLEPGRYTITVEISGFRPQTKNGITLDVQQTARFDFTLEIGAVAETVDVRSPRVDAQTSSLGQVIDNINVRELPLNGRNPLELSRLTLGTELTRQAVTKHLRVLEGAGVVRSVRSGRESLFALEPLRIAEVRDYLDQVSRQWDDALARLKAHVEE